MMSFYKSVIGVHKFNGIREILLKKKAKKNEILKRVILFSYLKHIFL